MISLNRNELLSDIAIKRGLSQLHPGWMRKGNVLTKTYEFNSFPAGVNFVVRVAQAAETARHHPDIDIRYTKVTCTLTTHDIGGITQQDLDMANEIDFAAER